MSVMSTSDNASVFISACYEEFGREIRAIEELIRTLGLRVPVTTGAGLVSEILLLYEKAVREADLFIGVYGSAIGGMVPDTRTLSHSSMPYLEWEYRMAEEEGIPVLAFVHDVKFRDDRLVELLRRIISRKGAYRFRGQRDLLEGIKAKLPELIRGTGARLDETSGPLPGRSEQGRVNLYQVEEQEVSKPPPKVFISYAWEKESDKEWAQSLATRLRSDGIEVIFDEWSTRLGDRLPAFMEKSVRESDFVVFVCTPEYAKRSDEGKGGVGYEGHIISSELFYSNNEKKFIPVLRQESWDAAFPTWAKGKIGVDLRGDPYSEAEYEKLLRCLHGINSNPPPLGPVPLESELRVDRTSDSRPSSSVNGSVRRIPVDPQADGAPSLILDAARDPEWDPEAKMYRLRIFNRHTRAVRVRVKLRGLRDLQGCLMQGQLPLFLEWTHHEGVHEIELEPGEDGRLVSIMKISPGHGEGVYNLIIWGATYKRPLPPTQKPQEIQLELRVESPELPEAHIDRCFFFIRNNLGAILENPIPCEENQRVGWLGRKDER